MHRCADGDSRGGSWREAAAEATATAQIILDERAPGWEFMLPIVSVARDVWPHLCVAPWGANAARNTWGPCWQYDRAAPAVCDNLRALVEAHGSEDGLDQYDWSTETRYRSRAARGLRVLLMKAREWTKTELLAEKPRGELLFRDDDGTLYECFICHGCQSCWEVDPETMELHEAYPHVYRMDAVVEVTV